ncbi:MAG: UDP-glucose 4-epimerase GalE [Candidatus Latescibacteria bacterium]|nr:UDP-glucose 4-epimerase GalE [Candidatus Latescibacterota bacterium]
MAVLVTGGGGYIGSATVEILLRQGRDVVVLDDLKYGHRAAVPQSVPLYVGAVGDRDLVQRIAQDHALDACLHFAALTYVGESVQEPGRYYYNNVAQGLVLLEALRAAGVDKVVFSSTCATYGEPQYMPMDEEHPQRPENPYGWSKYFMERVLRDCAQAYGLRFVGLRYFNAAGATPNYGEDHDPENHLIPNVLQAALGRLDFLSVFGRDYPTPDGTPVRDYIHIADLGQAHALALDYLESGGASDFFNLGTGRGYSVMEVIETARRVTGRSIEARIEERRPGDTSTLVARADKAQQVLGWVPAQAELETIIGSAWDWHQAHPDGYADK